LLYLLNVPLFSFDPLVFPWLFSLGAASYHVAIFGLYTAWGWAFLALTLAVAVFVHPSLGAFLGYVGGFLVAAALGRGLRRVAYPLLYLVLYAVSTNVLALASLFMPYLLPREDVPDPLHAPLYYAHYLLLHWAFARLGATPSLLTRLRAWARRLTPPQHRGRAR